MKFKVIPDDPKTPEELEALLNDQAAAGWTFLGSAAAGLVFVRADSFIVDNKQNTPMIRLKSNELTVSEAYQRSGIPRTTIRWNIEQGRLPATKVDGIYVIKSDDLERWIKSR